MSTEQQPSDRDLIAAVEQAQGVERGRALFAARHAMQRHRNPNSNVSKGRGQHTSQARRR